MIWNVCCSHGPVGRPHAVVRLCPDRPQAGGYMERSARDDKDSVRSQAFMAWQPSIRAPQRFTKQQSKCAMLAISVGTSTRHFRFTAWTTRWASANRG